MVTVTDARVPERLGHAVFREPVVEAAPGVVLLRVPRVGRFLVRPGDPVRVEREPGATDADIRCFLDGPVAAAAAFLRGSVALHPAAISLNGRNRHDHGHLAAACAPGDADAFGEEPRHRVSFLVASTRPDGHGPGFAQSVRARYPSP